MKKSIKVVAFFLFIAVFTLGCNNKDAEASTYGENISLSEFQGKVVIVDFWATWCPPCRKGVPDLIQLQNEYDQVVVIGISLDAVSRGGATANDVVPFMKEYGINYPIVKGDMNVIQQYGGIQSIPTSFVIDRRGFVVARHVGLASIETYRSDIEKALAGNYNREDYIKAPDFSLPTIK
ncbi:MAG: TlpA family protein disulfide reductase [Melioribacteraceae bacterium]|nr:TlpA family protein disulfide reductase [Melioribacteraceae bacterium]